MPYEIAFDDHEVEKLKQVATTLKGAAGQNPEWNALADWLAGIVSEDADAEETPDKPKKLKKKK